MFRLMPILFVALALTACGKPATGAPGGQAMPPMPVGVAAPISKDLPVTREFTGRIEAIETVELRPRVSGQVIEVCVPDGAEVKAGELVLRIDPASFDATAQRARSAVDRTEARLHQSQSQFDRSKQLLQEALTSQQDFDDAAAGLEAAKADLAAAKADQVAAELDLEHTRVVAPIAGRLGKLLATVGNVVQGGGPAPATLLATINRSDDVYASFDVDETTWRVLAPRMRPGKDGNPVPVPVAIGLAGEEGHPHAGVLAFADNQIDPTSGSIRLRARLANPDRVLTPGAFARISLEIAPPRPVLLVNERAVQAQLATRYVLVVDAAGATSFRPVVLGASVGGMRVVESGLGPDDRIAVNNLVMLFPGRPVTPLPASMETLENAPMPAPGGPGGAAEAKPAAAGKAAK